MSEDHVAQAPEEAPRGYKMFKEQQNETTQGRAQARLAEGSRLMETPSSALPRPIAVVTGVSSGIGGPTPWQRVNNLLGNDS